MNRSFRLLAMVSAACTAVIILVLWVRSYAVSVSDLRSLMAQLRWWPLPAILALLACHVALAAARWARIEEALGAYRPPLATAFTAGAIALGLGTILPGPLTNIGSRALTNRLDGNGAIRGAVSGTIDQLADLATVLLFVPAAMIGVTTQSASYYLAGIGVTAVAGFLVLDFVAPLLKCLSRLPMVPRQVETLILTGALRPIYYLSLLRFACLTALTVLIHCATGAATLSAAIIAIPLVTVAISVAMLPGGLGVSEWSFSTVLAALGIEHGQIVTFVLGNRILLSAGALLLMSATVAWVAIRATQGVLADHAAKAST